MSDELHAGKDHRPISADAGRHHTSGGHLPLAETHNDVSRRIRDGADVKNMTAPHWPLPVVDGYLDIVEDQRWPMSDSFPASWMSSSAMGLPSNICLGGSQPDLAWIRFDFSP